MSPVAIFRRHAQLKSDFIGCESWPAPSFLDIFQ